MVDLSLEVLIVLVLYFGIGMVLDLIQKEFPSRRKRNKKKT
jgi:hypothetical protein